jgi:hypothetical protein
MKKADILSYQINGEVFGSSEIFSGFILTRNSESNRNLKSRMFIGCVDGPGDSLLFDCRNR